jgi:hypothetical protein
MSVSVSLMRLSVIRSVSSSVSRLASWMKKRRLTLGLYGGDNGEVLAVGASWYIACRTTRSWF